MLAVCAPQVNAAPFAKTVEYTQPNGETVQLWGQGDDFYAVFETLDGYTVLFDQALQAYVYAELNADGTALLSTGVLVGAPRPAALQPHLRINRETAVAQARARQQEWEQQTGIRDRWNALKMERRTLEQDLLSGPITMAPPSHHTIGEITGIVLLIDFDDDTRSITRTEIDQYCNLPGYGGFGNNGSVRDYFYEVSNGALIYTNVVLQYVRIPNSVHPKSYYTNPARGAGESANELIHDALKILTAQSNYASEIAPLIDKASINNQGRALALNVFYSGGNGGVWAMGLWPHMWGLYAAGPYKLTDRTTVFTYQITNMGNELTIGTFCHENGHMICGYPDLYDYDYDSVGGAGQFCIMGSGGHGKNPSQVCGYLKYASGWTTTVEVPPFAYEQASVAARISHPDFNKVYRTTKPGVNTEYFLFEARAKIDRDAQLPGQGVLIWHIDELGDRDNQSLAYNTQHLNYECSLVQADGLFHFQNGVNSGDPNDTWYAENSSAHYANKFTDDTTPSAKWWDGSSSNLRVMNFSPLGEVMTFDFIPPAPMMLSKPGELPPGREWAWYNYSIGVVGGAGEMTWSVVDGALPPGLNLGVNSGVISGYPTQATNAFFNIAVSTTYNIAVTNSFSLRIYPVHTIPYEENFDAPVGNMPDSWTQSYLTNALSWRLYQSLNGSYPLRAHTLDNFIALYKADYSDHVTRLITPRIDFGEDARAGRLSFYHYMERWVDETDELKVYYKTTMEGEWQLLATYTASITAWTQRVIDLPEISRSLYIAFQGTARYGHGVCIDTVKIWDPTPPYAFVTPSPLPNAVISEPYERTLQAEGGYEPYTFGVVSNALPLGMVLSSAGTITGVASSIGRYYFTVQVVDALGHILRKDYSLTVTEPIVFLFEEDFENHGQLPYGWTQEFVTYQTQWIAANNGYDSHPPTAQQGNWLMRLFASYPLTPPEVGRQRHTTRLVSPQINLGQAPGNITLYFWHHMQRWSGDQDELKVLVRNTIEGPWTEIAHYTQDTPQWTQRSLALPDPTATYYIAFEGTGASGYGVCIDNLWITDESSAPVITTESVLPSGLVGQSYAVAMQASGGLQPYLWDFVSGSLPSGMTFSVEGVLGGTPQTTYLGDFFVRVVGADGFASTNRFSLRVKAVQGVPFFEDFENGGAMPDGWSQSHFIDAVNWGFANGTTSTSSSRRPNKAYAGSYNAALYSNSKSASITRLITPMLDLGGGVSNVVLTFRHYMEAWAGDQDYLKIYYRNTMGGNWVLLADYRTDTAAWTERTINLPNLSATYFVSFEGWAQYGYGICIDNVSITGDVPSPYPDWLKEYFTVQEIDDALITGYFDDPDGDNIPNIWEYAFYLDPRVFNATGTPTGMVSNNFLRMTYRQNKGALDLTFQVEATTNLVTGPWSTGDISEVARTDHGEWWEVTAQHDVPVTDAPRRFMRLKLLID